MQIDLWQRRLGWACTVAIILAAGQFIQTRDASADEAGKQTATQAEQPPTGDATAATAPSSSTDVVQDAIIQADQLRKKTEEIRAKTAAAIENGQQNFQIHQGEVQKQIQAAQQLAQQQIQQAQEASRKQSEAIKALVQNRLSGLNESGKFWIGVDCKEASPELRTQLGLDEGQGLVVLRIAPDSPAEKAGLKQHDVLLSVDASKLTHVQDLSSAANAADGKPIELHVFRTGKEQSISITPAQRAVDGPVQIIAQPGVGMLMPGNMQMQFHLPDNLEVKLDRKGNEPAKVTVKRGNETWEATSDDLSRLPDDVRPFVQQMVTGGPARLRIQGANGQLLDAESLALPGTMTIRTAPMLQNAPNGPGAMPMQPPMGAGISSRVAVKASGNSSDLLKRLEQVSEQLEKTQAELKKLRETIPSDGPSNSGNKSKGEKE